MANSTTDARPAILLDGTENVELGRRLLTLSVLEEQAGLFRCEATFANWGEKSGSVGLLYLDRQSLEFGKGFTVRYGDRAIFDGRIMALEGNFPEGAAPEITVLAEDRLQDLRMTRRTRSFADKRDADVVRQLAADHGLQVDVELDGPTHCVLAQVNQSDLAFLRERCRATDAELWIEGKTLYIKPRAKRTSSQVELVYNSGLRSFRVCADLSQQRSTVTASGWSVDGKCVVRHDSTDSALGAELDNHESGASVLRAKLAERKEVLAQAALASDAEARVRAESHFRQLARRFVCGEGVAAPNALLRTGAQVKLTGVSSLFEGKYYVSETRWLFDELGLRVEFRAERPGLGGVTG